MRTLALLIIFLYIIALFFFIRDGIIHNRFPSENNGFMDKLVSDDGIIEKRMYRAMFQENIEYIINIRKCPECNAAMSTGVSSTNKESLKWTCPYCYHTVKYKE